MQERIFRRGHIKKKSSPGFRAGEWFRVFAEDHLLAVQKYVRSHISWRRRRLLRRKKPAHFCLFLAEMDRRLPTEPLKQISGKWNRSPSAL